MGAQLWFEPTKLWSVTFTLDLPSRKAQELGSHTPEDSPGARKLPSGFGSAGAGLGLLHSGAGSGGWQGRVWEAKHADTDNTLVIGICRTTLSHRKKKKWSKRDWSCGVWERRAGFSVESSGQDRTH